MDDFERLKKEAMKAVDKSASSPRTEPTEPEKHHSEALTGNQDSNKKCKSCAMLIPKAAKVCPFCRKPQGITRGVKIFLAILLFTLIGTLPHLFDKRMPFVYVPTEKDAYYRSQELVTNSLKAPATAQFPANAHVTNDGNNTFTVKSYVDAQNSFGALLRNEYTCTLQYKNGRWNTLKFDFEAFR